MAYSNSSRFRAVDRMTNYFYSSEKTSFDEIINDPERFLMNQEDVFDAEGGYAGAAINFATVAGSIGLLFTFRPTLVRYFMRGSLRFNEWALIGATGLLSYRAGYAFGYMISGDTDRLNNHYAAYHLVKAQNRAEGKINLMKKPGF